MKINNKNPELIILYEKMSEHTKNECAKNCKLPHTCCSIEYCNIAYEYAKEEYGIELQETDLYHDGHTRLPYMSETGCTVQPHLRPLCTLHTCAIYAWGFKPNDEEWTKKYFEIRERIDEVEFGN
jgi:hypothetical protein